MFYDGADNVIIKPLIFTTMEGAPTGIRNADDLKAFASAVNAGKSLAKYTIDGEVCLMNDIDMAGTDWSDYVIGRARLRRVRRSALSPAMPKAKSPPAPIRPRSHSRAATPPTSRYVWAASPDMSRTRR